MAKKYADYTVGDVLRLTPKWFIDKQSNADQYNINIGILHAISETHNHIVSVPFLDLFGSYDLSEFSVPDMNKAIFEYKPPHERAKEFQTIFPLTRIEVLDKVKFRAGMMTDIQDAKDRIENLMGQIQDYESNIANYQNSIRDYQNSIDDYFKSIRTRQREADGLTALGDKTTIDKRKLDILRAVTDMWTVASVTVRDFTLISRKPLVVNYVDAGRGVAMAVDFGYIYMTYQFSTLSCVGSGKLAYNLARTSQTGDVIHPHLSSSSICFGNVASRADRARENDDYKTYFELIDTVLTTYCPDNPYRSLSDYAKASKNARVMVNRAGFGKIGLTMEEADYFLAAWSKITPELAGTRLSNSSSRSMEDMVNDMSETFLLEHTGRKSWFYRATSGQMENSEVDADLDTIRATSLFRHHDALHEGVRGEILRRAFWRVGIYIPTPKQILRAMELGYLTLSNTNTKPGNIISRMVNGAVVVNKDNIGCTTLNTGMYSSGLVSDIRLASHGFTVAYIEDYVVKSAPYHTLAGLRTKIATGRTALCGVGGEYTYHELMDAILETYRLANRGNHDKLEYLQAMQMASESVFSDPLISKRLSVEIIRCNLLKPYILIEILSREDVREDNSEEVNDAIDEILGSISTEFYDVRYPQPLTERPDGMDNIPQYIAFVGAHVRDGHILDRGNGTPYFPKLDTIGNAIRYLDIPRIQPAETMPVPPPFVPTTSSEFTALTESDDDEVDYDYVDPADDAEEYPEEDEEDEEEYEYYEDEYPDSNVDEEEEDNDDEEEEDNDDYNDDDQ